MGSRIQPWGGLGPWEGVASPAKLLPLHVQGVAEAELERDIGRTLKVLIRSTRREVGMGLRLDLGWEQWASQPDVLSKPCQPCWGSACGTLSPSTSPMPGVKKLQGWLCSVPQWPSGMLRPVSAILFLPVHSKVCIQAAISRDQSERILVSSGAGPIPL